MASRSSGLADEAINEFVSLGLLVCAIALVIVVCAVCVLVAESVRLICRTAGTELARWLWGGLAALGTVLLLAALLAQSAPAAAAWLASIAVGAWCVELVVLDALAGPDLGSPGDLLAPWKPVRRAA